MPGFLLPQQDHRRVRQDAILLEAHFIEEPLVAPTVAFNLGMGFHEPLTGERQSFRIDVVHPGFENSDGRGVEPIVYDMWRFH